MVKKTVAAKKKTVPIICAQKAHKTTLSAVTKEVLFDNILSSF